MVHAFQEIYLIKNATMPQRNVIKLNIMINKLYPKLDEVFRNFSFCIYQCIDFLKLLIRIKIVGFLDLFCVFPYLSLPCYSRQWVSSRSARQSNSRSFTDNEFSICWLRLNISRD